jgi:DNA-binding XRE family transcriptional regulator
MSERMMPLQSISTQIASLEDVIECGAVIPSAVQMPSSKRPNPGLGGEIRRLRHAVGYSRETLAEMVGLDSAQISGLEHGDGAVSIQTLRLIAGALGTKLSHILENVGF